MLEGRIGKRRKEFFLKIGRSKLGVKLMVYIKG